MTIEAKFAIGDVVIHRLFNYRGAIYEVDPVFMLSDAWYEQMAKSRPPKDAPWYRVLVHNALHSTYVAEQNLRSATDPEPIAHPAIGEYFQGFANGRYQAITRRLQ
ncbi:MAG TPA: heat shock protein HspQ [Porticoccaceae bacterium]|nr:heat shock protein HspQ [Porticoccaceae bacterium]